MRVGESLIIEQHERSHHGGRSLPLVMTMQNMKGKY